MSGISSIRPFASGVVPQSNHKEKYNIFQLPVYSMEKVHTTKTLLKLLQIFDIKSLCKHGGSR